MIARIKALNDKAALGLAAAYGSALAIWLFAGYSIIGAFVPDEMLTRMLYWSNAAQLVFCPLSVYVSTLVLRKQQATHDKVRDIHTQITNDDDSPGGL